jgi:hypothetical protein
LVFMSGSSSGTVNGQTASGSFTCIAPVEALQFKVPNYVTGAMPAGTGTVGLSNCSNSRYSPRRDSISAFRPAMYRTPSATQRTSSRP